MGVTMRQSAPARIGKVTGSAGACVDANQRARVRRFRRCECERGGAAFGARPKVGSIENLEGSRMHEADASGAALDELSINTIRTLAMDAVRAANSGHPGTPTALA